MEIVPPVPECVAKYPDEPVNCLFAENIHEFIKVPLFAIQSLYDSWSLYNIIGMRCPNYNSLKGCSASDRAYIEQYHQNTSRVLFAIGNKN